MDSSSIKHLLWQAATWHGWHCCRGLTQDSEHAPGGQAGLEKASPPADREAVALAHTVWLQEGQGSFRVPAAQGTCRPNQRSAATIAITKTVEGLNAKVRQDLPQRGLRSVYSEEHDLVTQHRPVELLCPVLSVSRDHEAVAQEGTQVPVQSSIFLAPKHKRKTLIRKGDPPHPRACCPCSPQPHPSLQQQGV